MTSREPKPFGKRWLRFDPERPTRPRLLRRFVIAVIGMMIVSALLAWLAT